VRINSGLCCARYVSEVPSCAQACQGSLAHDSSDDLSYISIGSVQTRSAADRL